MNLNAIYSKTYNFVYLRAKTILKKEEDIQQLMKKVYLEAMTNKVSEDKLFAWLGKRVYALGCEKYRKKKVREADLIEWDRPSYTTVNAFVNEDAKEVICEVLENLPDMYLATLYALYYDHMKLKEISSVLGYNVSAIIHRVNYIHKYMEKAIANYCQESGADIQFTIKTLSEALCDWSENHKLDETVAQNIFGSLCREAGVKTEDVDVVDAAGLEQRVTVCEDEINAICLELDNYSTKKVIKKKKLMLLAGFVVAIAVSVGVIVNLNGSKDEEKPEVEQEQQDVIEEEESTDTDWVEESEVVEEESDYILPNALTQKLTLEELKGLTKEELRLARNEIYARYGMIFGAADLREYFQTKTWYEPTVSFDEFYDEVEISEAAAANVSMILELEEKME